MITCIEGCPGSGKSYAMTEMMVESLRKGRKVLTNARSFQIRRVAYDLELKGVRNRHETVKLFSTCNIKDIPNINWDSVRETDIYLDEVMVVWLSREWKKFPTNLIRFLSQHRKLKSNLIYVTQSADLVDSALRALTGNYVRVRNLSHFHIPFLKFLRFPQWFLQLYTGENPKIKLGWDVTIPSKRIYGYFDSWALVIDEDDGEVVDLGHARRAKG